jgi:hypothetical protein
MKKRIEPRVTPMNADQKTPKMICIDPRSSALIRG